MGNYQPGMYYPICLGEMLAERFRIEHKISHGGFSTVWMAYDICAKTNVALKIMVSGTAAENEYCIQQEIIRAVPDTSNMALFLGTFFLQAGQYCHRVLVFPLLGRDLRSPSLTNQIPIAIRMSAAKQLLIALANLHNVGIVHRGKLIFGSLYLE